MSWTLAQSTLPAGNAGYVAAAYLVFFALVLAYFAIMAAKLQRLERDLVELNTLADRQAAERAATGASEPATTRVSEPAGAAADAPVAERIA